MNTVVIRGPRKETERIVTKEVAGIRRFGREPKERRWTIGESEGTREERISFSPTRKRRKGRERESAEEDSGPQRDEGGGIKMTKKQRKAKKNYLINLI